MTILAAPAYADPPPPDAASGVTDAFFRALHDRKLATAVALVGLPFTTDDVCQQQRSPHTVLAPTLRPFAGMDDAHRTQLADKVRSERLFSVSLPGGPLSGLVSSSACGVAVARTTASRESTCCSGTAPLMMD
jgi:hypothetical protein